MAIIIVINIITMLEKNNTISNRILNNTYD
jgi:hypothetical protein